jgi:general secretion pathway protein K
MFGMISGLAAVLSRSVSSAAMELGVARIELQSESDLRAGIELAVASVARLGKDMRSADAVVTLPDRRISVRMINERGRVDLNAGGPALLTNLLKNSGVFEEEAAQMAQAMIDWRGGSASQKLTAPSQDSSARGGFTSFGLANTQSSGDMRQAPTQVVGTRYFQHPLQLLSVPGFSRTLVANLLPNVTVASASNRIDPYIAPQAVLGALPGSSPENADQFREVRTTNTSRATALQILGADENVVTTEAAPGWRVFVTSTLRNGRRFQSEAVIAIIKGDSLPYRILYVLDQVGQSAKVAASG